MEVGSLSQYFSRGLLNHQWYDEWRRVFAFFGLSNLQIWDMCQPYSLLFQLPSLISSYRSKNVAKDVGIRFFEERDYVFFFERKKFKRHPGVMWDRKFLIEDNNRGEVSWNSWFSKFGAMPIICPKKASHNERCGRFWELQLVSEWFPGYVIVDNGWLWKKIGSKAVSA